MDGSRKLIAKRRKCWRESLDPDLRVAITLQFLAMGKSCKSLKHTLLVSYNTISFIVPETYRAIAAV